MRPSGTQERLCARAHRSARQAVVTAGLALCLGLPTSAWAHKLCTFVVAATPAAEQRLGLLTPDGRILDVNRGYALMLTEQRDRHAGERADRELPPDMVAWLERGDAGRDALDRTVAGLGKRVDDTDLKTRSGQRVVYERQDVRLLAPVPRPVVFRDAGGFVKHIRKQMGKDPSRRVMLDLLDANPLFITYASTSFAGTDSDLLWPNYSDVLDYEIEVAAVIGRKGRNIPRAEARRYIAGYTVYNDVSARDYQIIEMSAPFGSGKGKNWDGGNVLGPCLVTADEFTPDDDHAMVVRINGKEVSRGTTRDMDHKFDEIVSFISEEQTIYPGEVIGSATVEGGSGMDLRRFIDEGDTVELEIDGIGVLKNRFVRDATASRKPFPSALATLLPKSLNTLPPRPMKVVEVADRVYAGIQVASGVVAYSNMFYVAAGPGLVGDSLLDVRRTQQMIDLFRAKNGPWPPRYLVNSHADVDHVFGNQLFKDSQIIAHKAFNSLSPSAPKEMILAISNPGMPQPIQDFLAVTKEFDLRDVVVTPPTRLLEDGEVLDLELGDVPVHIQHVGPAHKDSDVVIWLPKQRVLFAGDLVFNGLTPHITGDYEHAMATYRYLESLHPSVVVPGHGEVTDAAQITRTRHFFERVHAIAEAGFKQGKTAIETAKAADLSEFADWANPGHVMITINTLYRQFSGATDAPPSLLNSIVEADEVERYWAERASNRIGTKAAPRSVPASSASSH